MGSIKMTRDLFLWCMSVIYMCAFTSLYVQIPGLYYDNGILPARLAVQKEATSFRDLVTSQPTLLRLVARVGLGVEAGLDLISLGGIIVAFVATVSRNQRNTLVFALLWVFYLSLFQVGQTFMWFQWDILLLEAGFLAILASPFTFWKLLWVDHHQHDSVTMWLVKWLLFRLMFASGVVKLTSQCPTWWGLTALTYHFETQCIPTPLAWYFHQLPVWFQKLSVVSTYLIEMGLPFLFFSPIRTQRILAFYGQLMLQLLIIFTGNYNFFNLLTITLCVSLLDDNHIRYWLGKPPLEDNDRLEALPLVGRFWRVIGWTLNTLVYGSLIYWSLTLFRLRLRTDPSLHVSSDVAFSSENFTWTLSYIVPLSIYMGAVSLIVEVARATMRSLAKPQGLVLKVKNIAGCAVLGLAAAGIFAMSLVDHTVIDEQSHRAVHPNLRAMHDAASSLSLTSSYGLFRTMTGVGGRPEVIIEGSHDLVVGWKEYGFKYKPGNVTTKPPVVAPHQPRLDWQMWFAALGSYQHNPWFLNLAYRILTGQPEVLELMGHNPFPDKPPKYLRATLYHYHYTSIHEGEPTYSADAWWTRSKERDYMPIISVQEPSFRNYLHSAGILKPAKPAPGGRNYLTQLLSVVRCRVLGQPDGFVAIAGLFITALLCTFLDPSVKLRETAIANGK